MWPYQGKRDDTKVGLHKSVSGAVSRDDGVLGKPNGDTRGDDRVGLAGQVICIYPYVPLIFEWNNLLRDLLEKSLLKMKPRCFQYSYQQEVTTWN